MRTLNFMLVLASPPTGNSEWLKVLLSALGGLLTGLLADTLKAQISNWNRARTIARVLHRELAALESALKFGTMVIDPDDIPAAKAWFTTFRPEAFDGFFASDRPLFFTNDRLSAIRQIFDNIFSFQTRVKNGTDTLEKGRTGALAEISNGIQTNILSRRLMERYRRRASVLETSLIDAEISRTFPEKRR